MALPGDRRITPRDLFALQFVGDPRPAPDGTRVAFVVTTIDEEGDDYRSRVWLVPAAGGTPRPLTGGEKNDTAPRWSPDGRRLAFLSTRDGKPQIYLLDLAGGEAVGLTSRKEGAGEPVWSPDGRRIAFVAPVAAWDEDADEAYKGKSREERDRLRAREPLRIERLKYRFDGRGFIHGKPRLEQRSHLFVLEVDPDALAAGGKPAEPRQLTDGDWDDQDPAWSPDGAALAFVSYREADRERVFRADIWTVPADGGGEPRRLTGGDGSFGGPAWSPDGRAIAYTGALEANQPLATTRLWTVPAGGDGATRCLTADYDRDLNSPPMTDLTLPRGNTRPVWAPGGEAILVLAADGGNQGLLRVPLAGGDPAPVLGGERGIVAFSTGAGDGPIVYCATDGAGPAELFIARGDGAAERRLTDLNRPFLDAKEVSPPRRLRFKGGDEHEIDGWLIPPVGAAAGERFPLILMIHGGPHGQYGNAFFHEFQMLAARGYGVLYTNPHGSTGRGAAFAKELAACWGEKDLPDLLAGVDHAVAAHGADPERLGVGGGSYGGFLTNWIIGHTDRFKAAVSMRSIANLLNFWGTSDIFPITGLREWGTPWEDFERYRRFSPIMYAANFATPTLILHQEEDYRCPIEQGEQLFAALVLRGVPARFVRFPQESHGLSRNGKPGHRLERLEEIVAWYDRYELGARG